MLERSPLQQLHGNEVLAVCFVNLVNPADVRMIECRGSEGFPLKSLPRSRIIFHLGRKKLQRHMAMQLEVFGFVDHTHPAATELRDDAIVRDGLGDHGGHHFFPGEDLLRSSSKKLKMKLTLFTAASCSVP